MKNFTYFYLFLLSAFAILKGTIFGIDNIHQLPDYYVYGINFYDFGSNQSLSSDELDDFGLISLKDMTRYSVNVEVPFDFGSSDGLVPYLGAGSNSINIRGIEGNRISLYIDGIPQTQSFIANSWNQSNSGPGGTGRNYFDPSIYENISINKSAQKGNNCQMGFSGSVNFRKPRPDSYSNDKGKQLYVKNSFNSLSNTISNQLQFIKGTGKFNYLAKLSIKNGEERENNGYIKPNPSESSSLASLLNTVFHKNDSTIDLNYEHYESDVSIELDSAENTVVSNERVYLEDSKNRDTISFQYSKNNFLSDSNNAIVKLYYQETSSKVFNIQKGSLIIDDNIISQRDRDQTITHDVASKGLSISNKYNSDFKKGKNVIDFGINIRDEKSENRFLRNDYALPLNVAQKLNGFCPSKFTNNGIYYDFEYIFGSNNAWYINFYADIYKYRVSPSPDNDYNNRLDEISTQYQIDRPLIKDFNTTNSSSLFKIARKFNNDFIITYSLSKGYRNPTPEELSLIFTHGEQFVLIPNPELNAEESIQNELSLSLQSPNYFISANLFYNSYKDFIDPSYILRPADITDPYNPVAAVHQVTNRGSVRTHGLELNASLNLDRVYSKFKNYKIGTSLGRTIGIDKTNNEWLDTIDPFKYVFWIENTNTKRKLYNQRLTLSGNFKKSHLSSNTFPATKAFSIFDYTGKFKFNSKTIITFGINNILDKKYYKWSTIRRAVGHGNPFTDRLTEPGRTFFLSAIINF